VSVFQRGRKQGPLLWAYWCCCAENRERKHALFRHSVFFPWRCNKIKRFPLHTHFFYYYYYLFGKERGKGCLSGGEVCHRSLLTEAGARRCSQPPRLAAVGAQNASLVSDINFCAESPVGAGVTNGFYLLPKNTAPTSRHLPSRPASPPGAGDSKLPSGTICCCQLLRWALPLHLLRRGSFLDELFWRNICSPHRVH